VFSARIKGIRAENTVIVNTTDSVGGLSEIGNCARMVSIRAQLPIRADGAPSAQVAALEQ
jgi:hypothetical protein